MTTALLSVHELPRVSLSEISNRHFCQRMEWLEPRRLFSAPMFSQSQASAKAMIDFGLDAGEEYAQRGYRTRHEGLDLSTIHSHLKLTMKMEDTTSLLNFLHAEKRHAQRSRTQ
jgi:hypothetical protein